MDVPARRHRTACGYSADRLFEWSNEDRALNSKRRASASFGVRASKGQEIMQKLRNVAIAGAVSVMLMTAGAANASVRPGGAQFAKSAALQTGERKSQDVAQDNSLRMSTGTTVLAAAVLVGIGLAFLISDDKDKDKPVSPS